ncbi:hypothetical protein [Dysgonomonas macrotermitis]|uniref:Outer membrane autotransporter barrel domain-containing protein n=1 Tax=Dysgonomonas macrotermitis TaxID=1346286 RepID=A0A1M5E541_9BACT|nr:hypothetical protein [Dysgonomonas macrotermitis]SHF74353.1 hypothetical protein SAMN05444362_109151 [Dysgonomonas macrotermitis]
MILTSQNELRGFLFHIPFHYITTNDYIFITSHLILDIVSVGGGFFYHNLGIEYQLQRDFRNNDTGHSLGIKYKF